jgi:Ca2+-binding EF-hand superfamily protein
MHWFRHALKKISPGVAASALMLVSFAVSAQNQNDYLASFDADGDKRVSLEEFQRAMSWAFEQMDKNGDGILSPEEQLVPKAKTFTLKEHHDRLAIQFGKQDRNHDGFLSAKELAAPPQM